MPCRRAGEIDVDAFLVDSAAAEFDSFREHYPACEVCAERVADWSALTWAVREAFAASAESTERGAEWDQIGEHPEPEMLEAYERGRVDLEEDGMRIERHVSDCASCRAELALLARFDPESLGLAFGRVEAGEVAAGEAAFRGFWSTPGDLLRAAMGRLSGPGIGRLAIPVVIVTLFVAGGYFVRQTEVDSSRSQVPAIVEVQVEPALPESSWPNTEGQPDSAAALALAESAESVEEGVPGNRSTASPDASPTGTPTPKPGSNSAPLLAEGDPETKRARAPVIDESVAPIRDLVPVPVPVPATEQVAQLPAETRAPAVPPEAVPTPTPAATFPERGELLLAALTNLPEPRYRPPSGRSEVGWISQFGPVRSASTAPVIESLAPSDHTGLTLEASPKLWWSLDASTTDAVQVTLVDDEAIEPILRVDLPGPHRAGAHSIDLAAQGVTLAPEKDYRWFISIVVDENRPSRNPVSAGSLRVLSSEDERRDRVASTERSAQGHLLAELGIWYDAFDFFASLSQENPDVPKLAVYRDRLADQVSPEKR